MKTVRSIAFWTTLALLPVHLFVGCSAKKDSSAPSVAAPATPVPASQGTSDSGGGTGLDGKVFESYAVDPRNLAAYKEVLEPLLKGLDSSDGTETLPFEVTFKLQTWFIAPVVLDDVKKETLGVSFMKNATQQIARQKLGEVWISKKLYDAMSAKDQAELILHELVMSVYFMRFRSLADVCVAHAPPGTSRQACETHRAYFDRTRPAEKLRTLNEKDNENIRYVTHWLLETRGASVRDLRAVMASHGFDPRFLKEARAADPGKPQSRSISPEALADVLNAAAAAGDLPNMCHGASGTGRAPCRIVFTATKSEAGSARSPSLRVKLSFETGPAFDVVFTLSETMSLAAIDDDSGALERLELVSSSESLKAGDAFVGLNLYLRKAGLGDNAGEKLVAVVVRRGLIVSVDSTSAEGCRVRQPPATSLLDDALVIIRGEAKVEVADSDANTSVLPSPCLSPAGSVQK